MSLGDKINESLKINSVMVEVEGSFAHLSDGIRSLYSQKSPVLNNHVLLQNFAAGFERLIKILLLIKEKHITGSFPQQSGSNFFRAYRNGHGIKEMLEELLKYSKGVDLMNRTPMVVKDMEYLEKNPVFVELIDLLSDFAYRQRYDHIDTILQRNPANNINHVTPFDRFRRLVYSFSQGKEVSHITENEEERANVHQMIIHIEMGIRALCRFFTHAYDNDGRMFYGEFSVSVLLFDSDLGELKYLNPKHDPEKDYYPIDRSDERYKGILKEARKKPLESKNYPDWAFKVHSLQVLNLQDRFYLAEIDNKIYALNGNAQSHFKIPSYFASDQIIPRKYALYLLDEAKKL
jgi:hypothetical protein